MQAVRPFLPLPFFRLPLGSRAQYPPCARRERTPVYMQVRYGGFIGYVLWATHSGDGERSLAGVDELLGVRWCQNSVRGINQFGTYIVFSSGRDNDDISRTDMLLLFGCEQHQVM